MCLMATDERRWSTHPEHTEFLMQSSTRTRVLITGAGGPAAISFMKAVREEPIDVFAADMDPHAAGLYLVPAERRLIVPAGASSDFVPRVLEFCRRNAVAVFVPTVDSELLPVARRCADFESVGTRLLLASEETLALCVDKLRLLEACEGVVPLPRYAVFDDTFAPDGWDFPLLVKPRTGSGSRGIEIARSPAELGALPRGAHLLVQEFLPGEEYSVDVLASGNGEIIAAVPRVRMKVDSGIAVTSRTLHDMDLEEFARAVARRIGLTYTANVQFRRNVNGVPALLEVNPRFPGTMPLTVRSGVNMPLLSLRDVLGQPPATDAGAFENIAMIRYWEESYLDPDEIDALKRTVPAPASGATDPRQ